MAASKPKLRNDVRIVQLSASAPAQRYLITTGDGQQFQASEKLGQLLQLMDGTRELEELAREASLLLGRNVDGTQLAKLVSDRIEAHRLLDSPVGNAGRPEGRPDRERSPLSFALPLIPAGLIAPLTRALSRLFNPAVLIALSLTSLVVQLVLYVQYSDAFTAVRILQGQEYLVIFSLVLASMLLHELGHASACQRYGCEHGPIGVGFYLIFPVFYADVNDAWRLPRRARLAIDYGGVYFQLLTVLLLCGVFLATQSATVLLAILLIDTIMLMALHPFFRYDGYWLASDLLGIPNLRRRSSEAVRYLLARFTGRPRPSRSIFLRMRPTTTLLLYAYALSSHLFFLGFLVWLVFVLGPNLLLDYPNVLWTSLVAMGQAAREARVWVMLNELMRLLLSTMTLIIVFSMFARLAGPLLERARTAHLPTGMTPSIRPSSPVLSKSKS